MHLNCRFDVEQSQFGQCIHRELGHLQLLWNVLLCVKGKQDANVWFKYFHGWEKWAFIEHPNSRILGANRVDSRSAAIPRNFQSGGWWIPTLAHRSAFVGPLSVSEDYLCLTELSLNFILRGQLRPQRRGLCLQIWIQLNLLIYQAVQILSSVCMHFNLSSSPALACAPPTRTERSSSPYSAAKFLPVAKHSSFRSINTFQTLRIFIYIESGSIWRW